VLSRGATKTGRRNRPPHLCCGHRASSDHPVDRLLLPGLALEITETASNAGLDAAACDVRRRCSAHSGSTIAPQLMQRHPPYSWSPDPSPPRSSNFSRTINPPQRAHLIACLLPSRDLASDTSHLFSSCWEERRIGACSAHAPACRVPCGLLADGPRQRNLSHGLGIWAFAQAEHSGLSLY